MFKAVKTITSLNISRFIVEYPSFSYCTTKIKPLEKAINYEVSDKITEEIFLKDFKLYQEFITHTEENSIFNELEPHLKRLRYEKSHWDDAIHNYRETERLNWQQNNKVIISKMHESAFGPVDERTEKVLRQTHVLDLAEAGHIKPHIDSVKFCGSVVAGLSLLSDCVIQFVREADKTCWVRAHLPRYSFYVMKCDIRYLFTHEILSNEASFINGIPVRKTRRISVMCRNEPPKSASQPPILEPLAIQWNEENNVK